MDPRLYKAAMSGNVCFLEELLNENQNLLTKQTPQENTPLHIAVQYGNQDVAAEIYSRCKLLLTRPNIHGETPLHFAGRYGHLPIVEFLVKEIFCASWKGIQKGFEVLRQGDKRKNTVLHEAVGNGHLSVTKFLLKVDPKLACYENHAGDSPLFVATRNGMKDIVNQILIASPSSAHGGSDGQTALHVAIIWRRSGIVEDLLEAKPQLITETDFGGRTPLHYAADLGDHKSVQRLLDIDSSAAYILDKEGYAPIHIAARKGHINVLKQIIDCCPDCLELLDLNRRNALHFSALSGKPSVVRYMLETAELEGLINQADIDGNTPLHLATIKRHTWIVRYLIWDKRVDQKAKNKTGDTVFEIDESIKESCLAFPRGSKLITSFFKALISPPNWATNDKNTPLTNQEATSLESYRQMGQTLLMVATIITTVTFTAAFTMPGGFDNDVGPGQGLALLQSSKDMKWFVISDTIAMISSLGAACLLLWGVMSSDACYVYFFASANILTYIALQFTWLAFIRGIRAVMPEQQYTCTMAYIVGLIFHISSFFSILQLLQIFPISEFCYLLNTQLCKMKYTVSR